MIKYLKVEEETPALQEVRRQFKMETDTFRAAIFIRNTETGSYALVYVYADQNRDGWAQDFSTEIYNAEDMDDHALLSLVLTAIEKNNEYVNSCRH